MMEDLLATFTVEKLNPDGKKYDKVSRIAARSENRDLFMLLDANTDIYPIAENERYAVLLTETLNMDKAPGSDYHDRMVQSKADKFEYVMHGRLYKIQKAESEGDDKMEIYISFGGLQLLLEGSHDCLENFQLDKNYFICMRKLV